MQYYYMKRFSYLIIGGILGSSVISANDLSINELMQSNIDCIMDDINEFPDSWVELYNCSVHEIDLSSYSIGITDNANEACKLPSQIIMPGEFVIVYCDKQDEANGLHTDFRIDSGKGAAVYLFNGNNIVDQVTGLKKQPAPNVAYGRLDENSDEWGYQYTPTPGSPNCQMIVKDILEEPLFSTPGCITYDTIELILTTPEGTPEGATLHYTLDGSEPTDKSPVFEQAIIIDKSTTVRAKLFCNGYLSPRSTTHSYLMPDHKITLPVVSITGNPEYFYSDEHGILAEGTNAKPNYLFKWRRPVNIEYFPNPDKGAVFNQLGETRVKGGGSRVFPLRSLAVYANKRFGTKRFNFEFFPESAPGLTEWKSFELRNSGNDFEDAYMRDVVIQELMGSNTDLDWQPAQQSVLMINGEYKGIINLRPRSNDDYVYTFYEGLEDIDMFENWLELKAGDWTEYDKFKEMYNSNWATADDYRNAMDIDEYFNLMIMNIYFANFDFPRNNIVMWRPRVENGKWRWIAKDTDFGLGLYCGPDFKMLDRYLNPLAYDWTKLIYAVQLFRSVMAIDELKDSFVNRFAVYMGDFLNSTETNAIIDRKYNNIKDERPYHNKLYYEQDFNYEEKLTAAKQWAIDREEFFPQYFANFFNLGDVIPLTINKNHETLGTITFNGIALKTSKFDGKYFVGSQIELTTDSPDFTSWEISVENNGETTTNIVSGNTLNYTIPKCEAISINKSPISGIDSIVADGGYAFDPFQPIEVYSIAGINMGTFDNLKTAETILTPGIYIVRQQTSVSRIAVK